MQMSAARQRRTSSVLAIGLALGVLWLPPVSSRVAQATTPSAQQDAEVIWHEVEALVPTRLFFPEGFDGEQPRTLIVALHGYGSSAKAFSRVGEQLAGHGFVVAVPQSPYAFLAEGRLAFDWTLHHLDDDALANRATFPLVEEFLPDLVREIGDRYSIDRAYALGFSQGAVLAMATAIINHDVFDGVVSFGLPDFRPGWFPGDALASAREVAVLLVHGDADDRAPFASSEAARDQLTAAGYDVTLHRFRGGHSVQDQELELAAQWIRQKAGR